MGPRRRMGAPSANSRGQMQSRREVENLLKVGSRCRILVSLGYFGNRSLFHILSHYLKKSSHWRKTNMFIFSFNSKDVNFGKHNKQREIKIAL